MSQWAVEVRDLRKDVIDGRQRTTIFSKVSFRVAPGESVALSGPSGAGKSTLLQIVGGLDAHYEGQVEINGQSLQKLRDDARSRLRNRDIGFIFQGYNLLTHLSVLQNVTLPARLGAGNVDSQRALALLADVGLEGLQNRSAMTLSGGEKQRVAIARALYQNPKVVLCDEPTGNLDTHTAGRIVQLFDALKKQGIALIIATHDQAVAQNTDRVLWLSAGALTCGAASCG